jgi:hypothetical protein
MLPAKTDPRWKKIVEDPDSFKDVISALPTKVMLSGLKIKAANKSADELITIAYEFFEKNEKIVAQDIESIFK